MSLTPTHQHESLLPVRIQENELSWKVAWVRSEGVRQGRGDRIESDMMLTDLARSLTGTWLKIFVKGAVSLISTRVCSDEDFVCGKLGI